jgi:hypothetical protein
MCPGALLPNVRPLSIVSLYSALHSVNIFTFYARPNALHGACRMYSPFTPISQPSNLKVEARVSVKGKEINTLADIAISVLTFRWTFLTTNL